MSRPRFRSALFAAAAVALAGVGTLAVVGLAGADSTAMAAAPATTTVVAMRRVTEAQYRQAIADIFGADIKVSGRFEPEVRRDGLLAVGSGSAAYSSAGFEQQQAIARGVASQVLDAKHRDKVLHCKPAHADAADDACAGPFIREYGRLLFRRPLTEAEVNSRVALAASGATRTKDFHAGLQLALASLLIAPQHLFRVEAAEADPGRRGQLRLDGYARASRLSYLFWNTTPDAELLNAAERGDLQTEAGLRAQVDRLAASPRVTDGARAFFTDMLQLDQFDTLNKDAAIYPKFSQIVAKSAKEQTLRTVVDLLVVKNGDYRDIFTSRDTFLDRSTAAIYQAPYTFGGEWIPYTFPADADRAGILTEITFLSLFSHPGRSSPTKRGVALHEIFLCEPTPEPPANVDFSVVNNTSDQKLKTVRARLLAHATDETCASCHVQSDPPGLALERFDSIGQRRTTENGEPIDDSADMDGVQILGASGLGVLMHDNPKAPACLVKNLYAYGRGQAPGVADRPALKGLSDAFAADGYRLPALLKRVATSAEFYKPSTPEPDRKSRGTRTATNGASATGGGLQ